MYSVRTHRMLRSMPFFDVKNRFPISLHLVLVTWRGCLDVGVSGIVLELIA